jgi:hypothetical protein
LAARSCSQVQPPAAIARISSKATAPTRTSFFFVRRGAAAAGAGAALAGAAAAADIGAPRNGRPIVETPFVGEPSNNRALQALYAPAGRGLRQA